LAAFFGGIVAQEVVKFTGKFSPLRQWLYLDAFEVLPEGVDALPEAEFAPHGNRYDNAVALIGRTAQNKVMDQRVFVVGAGALGCEFLKNFAMMGIGCGPKGRITVTDMDRIEVSNLNRQFLFRSNNVGRPKSTTAAAAAQAMNGDVKVEALEIPVGDDTEGTFNDAFWSSLDVVTNALDNLKARTYVDNRCIFYGKPLLESGTLGTKANTQIVVPRQTECYSDSIDPPEEAIPMCTLRNFPHAIEHCIEWARDLFAGTFTNTVQEAVAFLDDPVKWLAKMADEGNMSTRRGKLAGVLEVVQIGQAADWKSCVHTARNLFHNNYYIQLKQLLYNFPEDYTDPATGVKFWSPPKRVPIPAEFNLNDTVHHDFIVHAAALIAYNYGVELPADYNDTASLAAILSTMKVPEFVPKNARIKASETDTTEEGADDDGEAVATLTRQLSELATKLSGSISKLAGAEFEKDDDSNHHIDFITAASNLRARNYSIQEATRFSVKLTAGRIIPAIATTTCAVTGLVTIELYKVIAGKPVDKIRNSFINLAINLFSMAEPAEPKRTKTVAYDPITLGPIKAIPEGFTRWDRFVLQGNLTPAQINAWLEEHHKIRLSMISCGRLILYNPILYRSHREGRLNRPIADVLAEVSGKPVEKTYVILDVSAEDDDGDVVIPPLQMNLA
jgi:ubiquitin-activating enzyme E1